MARNTLDPAALAGIDRVITGRRSVRRYLTDAVAEADLDAILDAARWAPSPHNSEPWRFVVLRGAEIKERLAAMMGERWQHDLERDGVAAAAIAAELRRSHRRITESPVVVVVCQSREGLDDYPDPARQQAELVMAAHSVGAVVQNMMLSAYARGLATGWMCAPLFCPDVVADALCISREFVAQGLITIGYPESWPAQRARRSMTELVIDAG